MDVGLDYRELAIETDDGERLDAWWLCAATSTLGHLLLCHGNAGNIGDRLMHAELLTSVGFDVLVFDYRGYGRSSGSPDEEGTYRDARAARRELLAQPETNPARVAYLGESLGGAVALSLAVESAPAALVLQSTFTSVREAARVHYPLLPPLLVPDAYPSLTLVSQLAAPLLVLHGERDDVVPVSHGRAIFDAAPGPKRIEVLPGVDHELVPAAGKAYAEIIADFVRDVGERR